MSIEHMYSLPLCPMRLGTLRPLRLHLSTFLKRSQSFHLDKKTETVTSRLTSCVVGAGLGVEAVRSHGFKALAGCTFSLVPLTAVSRTSCKQEKNNMAYTRPLPCSINPRG